MDLSLQGSLLDLTDAMTLRDVGTGTTRHHLAHGAWVDVRPGWLAAGDELFTALLRDVPWHAERRQMYDSVVDVPRLTKFYAGDETLPHPMLVEAREALSRHYAPSSASRSSPPGCASTATVATASPGTATASGAPVTATP